MKKNTTKLFAVLLLVALCAAALSSCGIIVSGEYRFGVSVVETARGQAAAAVIIDSSDKIALVRVDEIEVKSDITTSNKTLGKDAEAIKEFERSLVGKSAEDVAKLTDYADYVKAIALAITDAKDEKAFSSTLDHLAISLTFAAEKLDKSGNYTVVASASALSRAYRVAEKSVFCDPTPHTYKLGIASTKTDSGEICAAVLVDESGRIALVRIDELDFEYGKTDSKKTQGSSYGMTGKAPKGEWDVQIAHLEKTLVGRNKAELLATKGNYTDAPEADIVAGCTIGVSNYVIAIAAAMDNAAAATESYVATSAEISLTLSYTSTSSSGSYAISALAAMTAADKSAEAALSSTYTPTAG